MKLTWKDGLATGFVGAAVAIYGCWLAGVEVLGISGTRGFTVAVLVLGILACYTAQANFEAIYRFGDGTAASKRYGVLISTLGGVALLSAVVALFGASSAALTILVLAMVALWATASVHHLSMSRTGELVS